MAERQANIAPIQGDCRHGLQHAAPLGACPAQKFLSSRCIVEEPRDGDGGAAPPGDVAHLLHRATRGVHRRSRTVGRRRFHEQLAHGTNGRQRLAAKAEARHADEIGRQSNFRGRVALEREERIVALHAGPVVADANELASAFLNRDVDR